MKSWLLFLFFLNAITVTAQQKKTILAIFAHPDDETAIGEALIKYARVGHRVVVMIATDGKDGTRVTSIPAGDSLGRLRQQETVCACKIMGVEPPVFLSIERLDTRQGVGNYFKSHQQLRAVLKQHIPNIDPDLIITFGPDGDTHHSEHIVIGGAVTEVLLEQGWAEKYPLYYVAWTKGDGMNDLGLVDSRYLNVRVDYIDEDEQKALAAFRCYTTQYTKEEMESDYQRKVSDKENTLFFRRHSISKGMKRDFF